MAPPCFVCCQSGFTRQVCLECVVLQKIQTVWGFWAHLPTALQEDTIIAVFRTEFDVEFPYDAKELILYVGVGIVCGIGGALYVFTHRRYNYNIPYPLLYLCY